VRLGIFGGSFDPPHVGHLLAAVDAIEALALDRLILVPARVQPLKVGRAEAAGPQRLEMVRLLVLGIPALEVDAVELERDGLSFTVDTLTTFAGRYPAAERFLLVGADVLSTFRKWREPERVVQLATLAVLQRNDEAPDLSSIPGRAVVLPTRRIDVSWTEIRERVAAGKSIRGFVPDAVAAYIEAERLYR
jgi:nicotinate-nucleotide adenylyltransferase